MIGMVENNRRVVVLLSQHLTHSICCVLDHSRQSLCATSRPPPHPILFSKWMSNFMCSLIARKNLTGYFLLSTAIDAPSGIKTCWSLHWFVRPPSSPYSSCIPLSQILCCSNVGPCQWKLPSFYVSLISPFLFFSNASCLLLGVEIVYKGVCLFLELSLPSFHLNTFHQVCFVCLCICVFFCFVLMMDH